MKLTTSLTMRLLAGFLLYGSMIISAYAAAGGLDLTFGNNGSVLISDCVPIPIRTRVQADGKIVNVGNDAIYGYGDRESLISRHNANGVPDIFGNSGCGSGGIRYFNEPVFANDFIVAADGTYLIAGYYGRSPTTDLALFRVKTDGTLEGQTLWQGASTSTGERIALQSDGKVVVAGKTNGQLLLVRFNADGTRDGGFGTNGSVIGPVGIDTIYGGIKELLIQTDSRIIAAGNFGIVRFNSDGTLDNGFGTNGLIDTGVAATYWKGAALQTDGKIVFNSRADGSTSVIKRYNTIGTPDTSFGTNGTVSINDPLTGAQVTGIAHTLAIQRNGKILTAGSRNGSFAMSRYSTNGTLDKSFGTNGVVITPIGPYNVFNSIDTLALQPDGKVIASGQVSFNPDGSGMARYQTDPVSVTITNIEELYAAVNNPTNAGMQIVIASGVYSLSVNDPNGNARPNGGRLELQENMSLQGVVGDRAAVVINAANLPASSYDGEVSSTGTIRMGRGNNSIEWLTVTGAQVGGGGIIAHLSAPGTTHIRVAHVASVGNPRGIDIRNVNATSAYIIDADIVDNDLAGSNVQGLRIINFDGANGGLITARLSNNRSHGNREGLLVVNRNSSSSSISVTSSQDRFYENGAGAIILCGFSGSSEANGNTCNFTAKGTSFDNNNGSTPFDTGGLIIRGGENLSFPNGTSNNTVQVNLSGCPIFRNQSPDLGAWGARSNPASIGSPGTNNHVTIYRSNPGPYRVKQTLFNSVPGLPGLMNTLSLIDQ